MDRINKTIAQAYYNMYEAKTKRESWVPDSIVDEDVADFMGAAAAAAKAGKKDFKFGDKTYKVTMKKSTADKIEDAVEVCEKCGKVHEGSCNEEVKESVEELDEKDSDKYMWKDINAACMKAGMKAPQILKVLSGLKGKAISESPEEPRAKGEKDFKKMHDDNTEIVDEKDGEDETFDNIKKSADSIKK
jgi:hypothetical protein